MNGSSPVVFVAVSSLMSDADIESLGRLKVPDGIEGFVRDAILFSAKPEPVANLRGLVAAVALGQAGVEVLINPTVMQNVIEEAWSEYLLATAERTSEIEGVALRELAADWQELEIERETLDVWGVPVGHMVSSPDEWSLRLKQPYGGLQGGELRTVLPVLRGQAARVGRMVIVVRPMGDTHHVSIFVDSDREGVGEASLAYLEALPDRVPLTVLFLEQHPTHFF